MEGGREGGRASGVDSYYEKVSSYLHWQWFIEELLVKLFL